MTLKDPFLDFRKFRENLKRALGIEDKNDVLDEKSYPIGGEARILIDDNGQKIARLEIHGGAFEDPYHVNIRSSKQNILEAVKRIFRENTYSFGNVYLWDENDLSSCPKNLKK